MKSPDLAETGLLVKPHGIRGEMKADLYLISVKRFLKLKRIWLETPDSPFWAEIERSRPQNNRVIVKLSGIDDRNRAEELRNIRFFADVRGIPPAAEGEFDLYALSGFTVKTSAGKYVGEVKDILVFPAQNILVIDSAGREVLVPAVDAFIKNVDEGENVIYIDPIDGLLNTDES